MPRGGDAARTSPRVACSLEPRPRQALGFRAREAAVCHHNGDAFSPGFLQVLRYGEHLASRSCRCKPKGTHLKRDTLYLLYLSA